MTRKCLWFLVVFDILGDELERQILAWAGNFGLVRYLRGIFGYLADFGGIWLTLGEFWAKYIPPSQF